MKITFLGTSHGYAEKGRFTSCTLVEAGGHGYIIDAGAPVEAQMVNYDKRLEDIRGIFITHMHNDHIGGLSTLIEPFLHFRYNDQVICFLPEEQGIRAVIDWLVAVHDDAEAIRKTVRFAVTKTGKVFENDDVRVLALPTRHLGNGKYPAFSYIVESDGKSVLFTGDMSSGFSEYPTLVAGRHFDLVVCEMAHTKISACKELLRNTDTDRMLITHYYPPMIDGYEKIFEEFPFDISLTYDGLAVDL